MQTDAERIAHLESALHAVGMFLLLVDSKRRDHFVNWTPDTTAILDGLRAAIAWETTHEAT
jgi:hypothetical protein